MLPKPVLLTTLLLAPAAIRPLPDGIRLRPDHACYTIYAQQGGQQKDVGVTAQTIESVQIGGRALWRIVVHQRLGNGRFDMRDELVLDRASLRPVSLETLRNGKPYVRLHYEEKRVTGERWDDAGASHKVDQPLTEPVWEGDLYGPTFASLPLAVGAKFRIPFYQYDKGLGAFTVEVKGMERVATPAGPVDAWVLDAGPSADERLQYLISRKDRRELGYRLPQGGERLGGDCSGLG